jgi:hypothetical protein
MVVRVQRYPPSPEANRPPSKQRPIQPLDNDTKRIGPRQRSPRP